MSIRKSLSSIGRHLGSFFSIFLRQPWLFWLTSALLSLSLLLSTWFTYGQFRLYDILVTPLWSLFLTWSLLQPNRILKLCSWLSFVFVHAFSWCLAASYLLLHRNWHVHDFCLLIPFPRTQERIDFCLILFSSPYSFLPLLLTLALCLLILWDTKHQPFSFPSAPALWGGLCLTSIVIGLFSLMPAFSFPRRYLKEYTCQRTFFLAQCQTFDPAQHLANLKRMMSGHHLQAPERQHVTCLLVIGESASRHFMNCYGYPASNTPHLTQWVGQEHCVFLTHAYSPFTMTQDSVPYMLTKAEHEKKELPSQNVSLFDVMNLLSFKNSLFECQCSYLGNWLPPIDSTQTSCFFNQQESSDFCYLFKGCNDDADERLLPQLRQELGATAHHTSFLSYHLNGSHIKYNRRYPASFAHDFKACDHIKNDLAREYSISLAYTDHLLAEMRGMLEQQVTSPACMVYVSDHGEYIDGTFRSRLLSLCAPEVFEVPCFFWFNDAFLKAFPQKVQNLRRNKDKVFSHDLIFYAILDILDIKTTFNNPQRNILSESYELTLEDIHLLDTNVSLKKFLQQRKHPTKSPRSIEAAPQRQANSQCSHPFPDALGTRQLTMLAAPAL